MEAESVISKVNKVSEIKVRTSWEKGEKKTF